MAVQNNGGEFQEYQSAQNQLLNIRAQQEQNLNEQRVMAQSDASTNNVLYQAAGLMADNTNTETAANFNPQTQAVLNQYGLGQPRIQKSSSSQNSTQQVSKQNIVINNNYKTENTTTNNVTVPSGGPIQGRPVTIGDNGIGKFKVWLNTTFAQQQEAAARRDREYEIRQANLSKDSNKLMRRLESVGTNVGKALDPRRIAQATSNPMKMLFTTLGIVTIARSWPKIMEFVDKADEFFTKDHIIKLFGGDPKKDKSIGSALSKMFFDSSTGLIAPIRKIFKDALSNRKDALNRIDVPDWDESASIGSYLRDVASFLKESIIAIVDPSRSAERSAKKQIRKSADSNMEMHKNMSPVEEMRKGYISTGDHPDNPTHINTFEVTDSKGNKTKYDDVYNGDFNVVSGTYRSIPSYHLNSEGGLTGTAGSTVAQGNEIIRLFDAAQHGEQVNSMAFTEGISRLAEALESSDKKEIVVNESFLNRIKEMFPALSNIGKEANPDDYIYTLQRTGNYHRYLLVHKDDKWHINNKVRIPYNKLGYYNKDQEKYGSSGSDGSVKERSYNNNQKLYTLNEDDIVRLASALAPEIKSIDEVSSVNEKFQKGVANLIDYGNNREKFFKNVDNSLDGYNEAIDEWTAYNQKIDQQNAELQEMIQNLRINTPINEAKDLIKSAISSLTGQKIEKVDSGNAQKAMDYFVNTLGLTEDQARGIIANLFRESSLNPQAKSPDGGALGIAQWRGDRQKEILDLYNTEHPDKTYNNILDAPFDAQLEMVGLELTKGNKSEFFKKYKSGEYGEISYADQVLRGYEFGGNGTLAEQKDLRPEWNFDFAAEKEKRDALYEGLYQYTPSYKATVTPTNQGEYAFTINPQEILKINPEQYSDPEIKEKLTQLHNDIVTLIKAEATIDTNMVNRINDINAILQSNNQQPITINQTQSYTS